MFYNDLLDMVSIYSVINAVSMGLITTRPEVLEKYTQIAPQESCYIIF